MLPCSHAHPSQVVDYLVEAGLPFQGIQGLQVMYQEGPLQVSECLHPYLAPGITAQPGNTCKRGIQGKAHRKRVSHPYFPSPGKKSSENQKLSVKNKGLYFVPGHRLAVHYQIQKHAGS